MEGPYGYTALWWASTISEACRGLTSWISMNVPSPPATPCSCVPSPCIGVCRMDDAAGWCAGCLRTRDEITDWGKLIDREKWVIWKRLTQRRRDLPAPDLDLSSEP